MHAGANACAVSCQQKDARGRGGLKPQSESNGAMISSHVGETKMPRSPEPQTRILRPYSAMISSIVGEIKGAEPTSCLSLRRAPRLLTRSSGTAIRSVFQMSYCCSWKITRAWLYCVEFMEGSANIRPSIRMTNTMRESIRKSKTRATKGELKAALSAALTKMTGNSAEQRLIRQIAAMMNRRQDIMAFISIG